MLEIKDVEIFATGSHNGDTYSEADLDEMVSNYSKVGYMPPLKDGHCKDKPGMPALGWIQNVRRMGNKLVADFVDLHEKVYEAIKSKRYGTVSSEIFWNLKNNNGTFKRALKAVALLGAEIPGVADLKPLREVVFNMESGETKAYEVELDYGGEGSGNWDHEGRPGQVGGSGDSNSNSNIIGSKEAWPGLVTRTHYVMPNKQVINGKNERPANMDGVVQVILPDWPTLFITSKEKEYPTYKVALALAGGQIKLDDIQNPIKQNNQKEDTMTPEEIKKMQDDLAAAQAQVKEFEAKAGEKTDDKAKVLIAQLEDTQKKLDDAVKLYEETNKKAKELESTQVKERIQRKVDDLKVPAFRPFMKLFYELATAEAEKIVKFSENGKDEKTITAERVVDLCVSTLNKATEKLFRVETKIAEFKRDDAPVGDDPRVEVDSRVKEYMEKNNVKDYSEAMDAVLRADPELKKAYSAS